jgi:uncharacterized protein YecE (DUF72 family)
MPALEALASRAGVWHEGSAMRLHVGRAALEGEISRYALRFDLLEVGYEPDRLPKPATLRRWAESVPEGFVFSVVLPASATLLDGTSDAPTLSRFLEAADTLAARWLVVRTPTSARPSARTRRRLEELVSSLPRADRRIAWDPRGLWEDEDAAKVAAELGLHLARDVTRSEPAPGDVVYARLRALGGARRVSGGSIEQAIDHLAGRQEAHVVIEGIGAARAARMLRSALADEPGVDADDDDGYEEGELDDDESDDGSEEDEL